MSIDDKQERLYRESRMSERIAVNDSPERKKQDRQSFAMLNRAVIEEVIRDLEACEDKLFEYIYSKYTPCEECKSKEDKIRYLAESYPKRIKHNLPYFKNEFYSGNTKPKSKYPSNGVIGWGVSGFSNNSYETLFSSGDTNIREKPIERQNKIVKPTYTNLKDKKDNKPVKPIKDKRENKLVKPISTNLKEDTSPSLSHEELKTRLSHLEDDVFDIVLKLFGVPNSLDKKEKINYMIDKYRPIRIENNISYAYEIKK